MKSNDELQKDVQDAIKWESALCTSEIAFRPKTDFN